MSMTRKDIFAQLESAQAELTRIGTEHAAKVAELTQALESEKARADKAVADLNAGVEAAAKSVAEAQAKVESAEKCAIEATLKLASETEAHAATQKLLAVAKDALANPAQVDAAMTALNGGVSLQAQRDAEADKAEADATKPAAEQSVVEQWDAITDPSDRRAFYLAHRDQIKAELKKGG